MQYEQMVRRRVYAEHNHEYAELKRHAEKIKKLQVDIQEVRRQSREQQSISNTFRNNEKYLLKQIHVLETYLLEKMGDKGPYP